MPRKKNPMKNKRRRYTEDKGQPREHYADFYGRRLFAVFLLGLIAVFFLAYMAEIAHKQGWFS